MQTINTTFNLFFPVISNIGRKIFEFEDKLSGYFGPFELVPIPENAPQEIPRISAVTKNGHSKLNISQNNLSFTTTYDNKFSGNWGLCLDYVQSRVGSLVPIFSGIIDSFSFSGITTQLLFDEYTLPLDVLKDKFFMAETNPSPFDLNFKMTFLKEDRHYINITMSNIRIVVGNMLPDKVSPAYLKDSKEALSVIIDVNDRYGYNFKEEYKSNQETALKNIELADEIISNKISKFIEEGVINI